MQNGTQIIITNCEPSIHLGTSHPGGRGSKKIGFVAMNLLDPPWGSVIFVCLTPVPPPFPLYWQLVGSQFYTVLPLCILLMTNAPSEPLPLKTCDPPQTNTPPYPLPPPQGMKSDCLPLMCVWIVWILVYTNTYLYIFSFFFSYVYFK